jgi:hypothetical protein
MVVLRTLQIKPKFLGFSAHNEASGCRPTSALPRHTLTYTIVRYMEAPLPTKFCALTNRPVVSNDAYVAVARQPGDVRVLIWTRSVTSHP